MDIRRTSKLPEGSRAVSGVPPCRRGGLAGHSVGEPCDDVPMGVVFQRAGGMGGPNLDDELRCTERGSSLRRQPVISSPTTPRATTEVCRNYAGTVPADARVYWYCAHGLGAAGKPPPG